MRLIKEEAKFYDGIAAGLKAVADQKNFIIDADQKMLDIERLVSLSEEDYLAATLANHERRVQVQRDLIAERLKWNNVIDAREMEELERAEKLLEIQKERVRIEEILRKDPLAGATKALSDLQREYESYGKLMEDYTVGVFRTMEMAFADFCDTGQFRFKDFVRSALIQLNTLLFKIAVLEPMAKSLSAALQGGGGGGGGDSGGCCRACSVEVVVATCSACSVAVRGCSLPRAGLSLTRLAVSSIGLPCFRWRPAWASWARRARRP